MNQADLQFLEEKLNYEFTDKELLVRALTHKSLSFEQKNPEDDIFQDNEQLEFLGDSILGFIASELLLKGQPKAPEGRLSKLKAHLVSSAHLYAVAQDLGLGQFLQLGRGEEMSGGREKRALLADALEAIIAALYLDGGMEAAKKFVTTNILREIHLAAAGAPDQLEDFKSALQERAQAMGLPQPRYIIAQENGPDHAKIFVVEVRVGSAISSRGEGTSKKAAGQQAARGILEQLG